MREDIMQVVNLMVSHDGIMTETNQEHTLDSVTFYRTDTV